MKDFNSLQQEIINRGNEHGACNAGIGMVKACTDNITLLKAILRYWEWCFEDYEIIDDEFILDNFTPNEIKDSGIYLVKDKADYGEYVKTLPIPSDGWDNIVLGGKPLKIARTNLRDAELAKRDRFTDEFESSAGEHHFDFDNAQKAAEKVGCRLFTDEEQVLLGDCLSVWDYEKEGRWFRVPDGNGGYSHIFFPAAGSRGSSTGTINYAGSYGFYWSSLVSSTTLAYYLGFYSATVNTRGSSSRSYGFSVRCVAPQN